MTYNDRMRAAFGLTSSYMTWDDLNWPSTLLLYGESYKDIIWC